MSALETDTTVEETVKPATDPTSSSSSSSSQSSSATTATTASDSSSKKKKKVPEWFPTSKDALINAETDHTATVIFMHGLGDTPKAGWLPSLKGLLRSSSLNMSEVKWILPCAPTSPVTINMGMAMPSWHDIDVLGGDFSDFAKSKFDGRDASVKKIHRIMQSEIHYCDIPSNRIFLAGFSQGGALSIVSGLQFPTQIAGMAALSGYLCDPKLGDKIEPANQKTPVRMFHADRDNVVQLRWAQISEQIISDWKVDIKLQSYPIFGHQTSAEELNDFLSFVHAQIPPLKQTSEGVCSTT